MKKYFICLLIFCSFLLTGCDADYNLEVKDGKIIESTDFYIYDSDNISTNADIDGSTQSRPSLEEFRNSLFRLDYRAFNSALQDKYYSKKRTDEGIQTRYSYTYDNYKNSSIINYCFSKVTSKVEKNYLLLDFKDSSKCFSQDIYEHLQEVNVKIKTDFKVLENNADSVKGNTYFWQLERDAKAKNIHMKIRISEGSIISYLLILLAIGGIVAGVYMFVKFFKEKQRVSNDF